MITNSKSRGQVLFIAYVCLSAWFFSCERKNSVSIHYPGEPPKDSIVSFLPGIVCSGGDSIDFNAAFSPDGQSFYFSRSQNGQWDIYVTRYDGHQWTKAVKAACSSEEYSEADPAFDTDGALYFISNMPRDQSDTLADFDIWYMTPLANGKWSSPENLEIVNSDSTEYYVSFAGCGNLYFASSRPGGYGMEDIYVSKIVSGQYTLPENMGPRINSPYSDHDPCLPDNERFIIYTSVDQPGGLGEGDLYYATKDNTGNWTQGITLGKSLNTPTYEYCSYFSPDMKYFFFSSQLDVKWMRSDALPLPIRELL